MAFMSSSNQPDCIKIYYIDDDADDIDAFEFAIKSLNARTGQKIELFTYQEGDLFLRSARFDESVLQLVFLDVNMPTKSGFELLSELRQNDATRNFPVIMFSTSSNKNSIETSRLLGASNYITKPNNFPDLNALIMKAIDNYIHPAATADFLIK